MTYLAPRPPFIAARWHGGKQTPRLIVMHSTVSGCAPGGARAIAHYFAEADEAKTSAHYVVDPDEIIQCVPDHTVAYHCGYNQDSIGIEMCDVPVRASSARWADHNHQLMFTRAVDLVAQLCLAYDIRPWYVSAAGLAKGKKGITTHADMSAAFHRSTHWDPGAWPRLKFMRAVRAEINRIKRENA